MLQTADKIARVLLLLHPGDEVEMCLGACPHHHQHSTAIAHGILIGAGVGAAAPLDNQDQYWPQVHPGFTTAAAGSRYYNEFLPLLPIPINSPVAGSRPAPGHNHSSHDLALLCSQY